MKRIFVSQSEFDMGRNRNNRRLIAILDGIKLQAPEMPEVTFCQHINYCHVVTSKNCLFGEGHVGCRVSIFYERNQNYGRNNG